MTSDHPWRGNVFARYPELTEEVRAAIRERGPLASRDFEGGGGERGMWDWKPAKMVLEALWYSGEIVIAGRVSGFQRLYDLPERVLPRKVLEARVPDPDERMRELVRRAVVARGALTESGVVNHWGLRGGAKRIKPVADELVATASLERLDVEDGGAPVLVPAGVSLDPPRPSAAVLLSPFDNLLWDRQFVRASSASTTSWRSSSRRRSGSTATTCCRSSGATGSSAASTSRPSARRARSS